MSDSDTLGTGWGFPPQFLNNGSDLRLVSDEDDVRESLEILFSTAMNERLNYPDFGCDLKRFMFEKANNSIVIEIQQMILDAVYNYEPRIEVQNIEITQSADDFHILLIHIDYYIKNESKVQNIVYSVPIY